LTIGACRAELAERKDQVVGQPAAIKQAIGDAEQPAVRSVG